MKKRNFLIVLTVMLLFSGCVVYSFYPLYNKEDLFVNDILTGKWSDDDGTVWQFEHSYFGEKVPANIDSTSYILKFEDPETGEISENEFSVHIVKLQDHYFLDFYLEDYSDNGDLSLYDFHIIPVHTFAKLTVETNKLTINWFDQDWLEELIDKNKIRIHHEDNGDFILLTAKPNELQKFVTKYVNSEEAFEDGMEVVLARQ